MAHGDPTTVSIHSNDLLPLVLEAHQTFGSSIDLSNCGQIQVTIKNRDRRPGRIALGIVLTDSTAAGKTSLYLGEKPILSSGPAHPSADFSLEREIITFQVPTSAKIRQFDEITVLFFPDTERVDCGFKDCHSTIRADSWLSTQLTTRENRRQLTHNPPIIHRGTD